MNKRDVWSIVTIMEMPNGRKHIGNKWVLKISKLIKVRTPRYHCGIFFFLGLDWVVESV